MAVLYATYVIFRCQLRPFLAPSYEVPPIPIIKKIDASARYILPIGVIIFFVIGVIFLGIATPSESAAWGALGCFLLAAAYRSLSWEVMKKSLTRTISLTVMIFMIIVGATAFSQILAFSGASKGFINFAMSLTVSPIVLIIIMQIILLVLGYVYERRSDNDDYPSDVYAHCELSAF